MIEILVILECKFRLFPVGTLSRSSPKPKLIARVSVENRTKNFYDSFTCSDMLLLGKRDTQRKRICAVLRWYSREPRL